VGRSPRATSRHRDGHRDRPATPASGSCAPAIARSGRTGPGCRQRGSAGRVFSAAGRGTRAVHVVMLARRSASVGHVSCTSGLLPYAPYGDEP
jgi:hypothetical protein